MRTWTGEALGHELVGRDGELRALDDLVTEARAGRARVVVLRGEPGIGKTALLDHLDRSVRGFAVLRATGAETETGLAYAGLHQLVAPLVSGIDRLPTPQGDALRAALGLSDARDGAGPDPFLVGLAVLRLLAGSSAGQPLVCLVDDAHRLDRASGDVLAFVGRRLAAEQVVLVLAAPAAEGHDPFAGFPELTVHALGARDARTLVRSVVPGPLDDAVLRRLVAESGGNPRALREALGRQTGEQLAGGFTTPGRGARPGPGDPDVLRRVAALGAPTRRLLLVAAAEPRQEPVVVWRAAALLGLGPADAEPAEAAGLLVGGEMRFTHHRVRPAVYAHASADERRAAHRALAEATGPELEPAQHAWHRAHAAAGQDEDVAALLERATGAALLHGGVAAAAELGALAATLTPDPGRRAARALRAAEDKLRAGASERARQLLAIAEAGDVERRLAPQASLLRSRLAALQGDREAEPLLAAARRIEPLDRPRALAAWRDAFYAALGRGRHARRDGVVDVAEAVRAALGPTTPAEPEARLLAGLADVVLDGYPAGAAALRDAVAPFTADQPSAHATGWLPLAARAAAALGDARSWDALSARTITTSRETGRLPALAQALTARVVLDLLVGDLPAARALSREAATVAAATDLPSASSAELVIAAWRGDEHRVDALVAASADRPARGRGGDRWAAAMLRNALREYPEALVAAEEGSAHAEELGVSTWSAAELVEAAARTGAPERGHDALRRVTEVAQAGGSDWMLGLAARSRALLSDGTEAEAGYREAVERLGRTPFRFLLARAHLVHGEWLRREGRRADAREKLGLAHEMLADMGADGFAARARHELAAAGVTARRRTVETTTELTEQEAQIARLTALGHTNPEIAARLFLSHRTVEWHLRKVFAKLGISSRREVGRALGSATLERLAS